MRFQPLVFTLFLLSSNLIAYAQNNYIDSLQRERDAFATLMLTSDSILTKEEREEILAIEYFPIDEDWIITARFKKRLGKPFEMPTTTERKPMYQQMGWIHFKVNGKKVKLAAYKNLSLSLIPEYKNYVFIPFRDGNSPATTYGGGRYLDLEFPLTAKEIEIDFNTVYNPYCVYSYRYSCPITPKANHIKAKIEAGVKNPSTR